MSINYSPWTNFGQQLMGDFQNQYGAQSGLLSFLMSSLKPFLTGGGQGFGNPALTTMRTGASDQNALDYQHAQQALQNNQIAQDPGLPSGVVAQQRGALLQGKMAADANAQNNITLADEQQREANQWNATNALLGVSAGLNPLGYAGAAAEQGNTAAAQENANANMKRAEQGGFGGMMKAGLGAGLGAALGGVGMGQLGSFASTIGSGNYGW